MKNPATKSLRKICYWVNAIVCTLLLGHVHAQETSEQANPWTRFRGPNGTGVLEKFEGPLPWNAADVAHRVDLPGTGNGSPVIWGNQVFLQVAKPASADASSSNRSLIAIDAASGKIQWQHTSDFPLYSIHKFSSYASSTPCVDKEHVYNVWGQPESLIVEALTHEGKVVWQRDLGTFVGQHGFGSSPMLVGDFVVLYNSQDAKDLPPGVAPGKDRIVAMHKATGETAWETELHASNVCYGVPCVIEYDNKPGLLAANTLDGFFVVDARNGEKLMTDLPFGKRVVCSCSFNDDIFVASEGSGGGGNVVVAMDRRNPGKIKFRLDRAASYVPSTLIHNDLLFVWADNGIVTCVDTSSGKQYWTKRVGGNFSGSPVLLGDKLVNVSHEGIAIILRASSESEELASIDLEQPSRATPAATQQQLFIRTESQLWIIGKQQSPVR